MDRRSFLLGLAGVFGAGATVGFMLTPAQATVLDQLKTALPVDDVPETAEIAGVTPDGTPVESVQYWRRPPPPRRRRRRRVRVCRTRRDRWGRRIRRCWYEWR